MPRVAAPKADPTDTQARWANKIVGYADVPPESLEPSPYNWRTHPIVQQQALQGVLEKVGWVQDIIVSKRSGTILDGHLRVSMAKREGQPTVPIKYVDVSEEEEKLILLTFDPISAMNTIAKDVLSPLLAEVTAPNAQVEALFDTLRELGGIAAPADIDLNGPMPEAPRVEDENEVYALREDAVFSSTNEFGIPDLREDKLCQVWPQFVYRNGKCLTPHEQTLFLHGYYTPKDLTGGYLGFFVEDYKFEEVYAKALQFMEELKTTPWTGVLAPDFSLWHQTPPAIQLFNVFSAQWTARYWQEVGFNVIPLINAMGGLGERSVTWACLGIPLKAPVVCVQCRTGTATSGGREEFTRGLIAVLERLQPGHCLVYGGMDHVAWLKPLLPPQIGYSFLPSRTTLMRRDIRNKGG